MARWTIAILLVLNLAVAAWSLGAFQRWDLGPSRDREPERLSQQLRPEAIERIVPEHATPDASSAPVAMPPALDASPSASASASSAASTSH